MDSETLFFYYKFLIAIMLKTVAFTLFTFICSTMLLAQTIQMRGDTTSMSLPISKVTDINIDRAVTPIIAPTIVEASDGIYPKYVRIVWKEVASNVLYKVYRRFSGSKDKMTEITKDWKKANWIIDNNNVIPNIKYDYAVVAARDVTQISAMSKSDIGYAKEGEESVAASTYQLPIISPNVCDSLAVSLNYQTAIVLNRGESAFPLPYTVYNKSSRDIPVFEEKIYIYLSQDAVIDAKDTGIGSYPPIAVIKPQANRRIGNVYVPKNMKKGTYNIVFGIRCGDTKQMQALGHFEVRVK
jgi:hypothetical protein